MSIQARKCFVAATRVAASLVAALTFGGGTQARADYVATPNPSSNFGTWQGWGCSLAWWANAFGDRNDLADAVFTTNASVTLSTHAGTYSVPGLGMNVVRYNIGGYGTRPVGTTVPVYPATSTLPGFKRIPGYWLDWYSTDPSSSSFDWYTDAQQRNMMWKARDRGANVFEAFSNSPMWWMNYNKSSAGSNGGGDNLQSWNYGDFARYLATVVKYAKDHWGVSFTTVEPFNEPAESWWTYPKNQEGCHFDNATQRQVLAQLRTELNNRGLQSVGIAASDENSPDRALSTWNAFDTATKGLVNQINVHGYSGLEPYRGPNRGPLYSATSGKRRWVSEYGDGYDSGMPMADSIVRDLWEYHPSAWVYWQPFDSGGWGLIQSNPGDNWIGTPNAKWYVMAQFSRHIRPGMMLLGGNDPNTVFAYDATARKLVVVTVNFGTAQWIDYDLSRFGTVSGPITRWATVTASGGDRYARYNDTNLSGKRFWSWFPANTVQTFEVQGISP